MFSKQFSISNVQSRLSKMFEVCLVHVKLTQLPHYIVADLSVYNGCTMYINVHTLYHI